MSELGIEAVGDETLGATEKPAEAPITDEMKVRKVQKQYMDAKEYRKNYKKYLSIDNLKWYKGEQYNPDMQVDSKEYVTSNRVFTVIEDMLPIMTDNNPKYIYNASDPADQPATDMLNTVIGKYLWEQMDMTLKVPENQKNTLIYGTGFLRPYWDKEAYFGMGDARVKVVPPQSIFPCPGYSDLDEKIPYFIYADYVSIEEITKAFPHVKGKLKPADGRDADIPDPAKETNRKSDGVGQVTDTTDAQTDYVPLTDDYNSRETRKCLYMELHEKTPEFPNGKITAIANNLYLGEFPNPVPTYPSVIKFIDMVMPGEFWGMGEVIQIKDPQKMINKFRSSIVNILRFTSDPPLLVDEGAIDDDDIDNWINEPGIVIEKAPGSQVGWMQMQMPDVGLINYIQDSERDINVISGMMDWNPSRSGNLPSGKSLFEYQEIAQTRLRLKMKNMKSSLKKLGIILAKMLLQYYTEPRIIQVMGDQGKESIKMFKMPPGPEAEAIKQQITEAGMIPLNLAEVKPDFDVEVSVEPAMPLNKSAKFQLSQQLYSMQLIDQKAVLDAIDYPERDKVMARMASAAQAQQEAQVARERETEQLKARARTAPNITLSAKPSDFEDKEGVRGAIPES